MENLAWVREKTKASLEVTAKLIKRKTIENKVDLEEGQKFWLFRKNITITHSKDKLAPKLHEPFPIEKKLGPITFKLKLLPMWKILTIFHASLLTPYQETNAHGPNFEELPPNLVKRQKEYKVEEILNKRK